MGKLLSIRLIELIVTIYDYITLPLYFIIQKPWKVREIATRQRAKQIGDFTWVNIDKELDKGLNRKSVDTLDELFRDSVSTYAKKDCLGVRKILAIEYRDSVSSNGNANLSTKPADVSPQQTSTSNHKVVSKYVLDHKYTWYTYSQIEDVVVRLSAGLQNMCRDSIYNPDGTRKILICADTCMQWFLMAHACFRNNITVVTAYTTLDDEAILHSIHQTEVKILVVSQKFARRIPKIVAESPLIETLILLDEPLPGDINELVNLRSLVGTSGVKQVISYKEIVDKGKNFKEVIESVPKADDIAVLMYTSGSTGKAKGVMLSHKSIVYTALSFSGPGDISHKDRYIGYLPLGHVLELAAECIFLRNGSTIAYSSPATLTNNSPMIKKGQFGDAYIFKPTIMGAVPLVLDRVKSGIQQAVKSQGPFYDQLINGFVIKYKRYWWERYYDTPILNMLVCKKFNLILGGKIRAICSGGAALSRETQEYLRHVTNYTVLQGYGLTETSAAASFCDVEDRRYNVVGAPYPIVRLKLESWSDYSVHDKPYPRGEIIIGGQPVSSGYYKMDDLTKEAVYTDEKTGTRYFRTGDIGLMLPDGVLKIIDRKKDIVKPLSGEYISLSEIEAAIRALPFVDNVCVYCSPYSNYLVALIRPEFKALMLQASQLFMSSRDELGDKFRESILATSRKAGTMNGASSFDVNDTQRILAAVGVESLCSNKWFVEKILKTLQVECAKRKLRRFQIPSKIKLVTEEWSPESGLVTASFKLRRREVEKLYERDIKGLYEEMGQKIEQNPTP